ncbi:MAG: VCBS repeat-containing protein, partial [Bdellovibrionales bacterium]|nr:VCBS repeat-containing protein [Bdellovibrionales bacterium]
MKKSYIVLLFTLIIPFDSLLALPPLSQSTQILERIGKQESAKDATCWTTARMMEQFYSQLPLSEEAALLKIEILKSLANQIWNEAGALRSSCRISKKDMEEVLAPYVAQVNSTFSSPEGLQARSEYARITENWRVLLSLFYQTELKEKKVLASEALELFGTSLTDITLLFLHLSSREAKAAGHREVQPEDMKQALQKLPPARESKSVLAETCPSISLAYEDLLAVTKQNVHQKISSLQSWNKRAWKSELERKRGEHDIALEFLAKVSPVPLTRKAQSYVLDAVMKAVRYISKGYYPERSNLMYEPLTLFNYHPIWDRSAQGKPLVLQSDHIFNVTQELFPRYTDIRGDVHLRLKAKHGEEKDTNILLEGTYLDALRDTTLHWWIMDTVWSEEGALPLEPLAAELLAERTSEMIGAYLQIAALGVEKDTEPLNTFDIQLRVHRFHLLSPERPEQYVAQWKEGLSSEHKLQYFKDRTSETIFSQFDCNQLSREASKKLQAGEFPDLSIQLHSGSGIAVGDLNSDGLMDLFISGTNCNRLLYNKGNFVFEDKSESLPNRSKLQSARHPLFADFNGDGSLDLLVVQSNNPSQIWFQTGDGNFRDVTEESGIQSGTGAHFAVAFDYNRDGKLDLFLGHYGEGNNPALDGKNGVLSQLYQNVGQGKFKNVTQEAQLHTTAWSLAGVSADFNGDGWNDIFLANDFGFDELFLNKG